MFRGYAPFISTDKETLQKIIDEIHIQDQSTVYELGCGRALFLQMVEHTYPKAKLIGIENLLSVYLFTKIKLKLQGSNIQLIRKDFFAVNLKNTDVVYCYLNNETMKSLGERFLQECKPGTQIISRSFPLPQLQTKKVITIKGKKVFFYTI